MTILSLDNIVFKAQNNEILKGISFNVEKGECISIVGSSGSGKSTLMKLCADLMTSTGGEILFKGKNYKDYDPLELRKSISYCIQNAPLFGDTVYENLNLPFVIRKEKMDKVRVEEFLSMFGLDKEILNKNIKLLSGGEKQRIALIRNLIFTPEILLLDEVTSALDNENSKLVEELVRELNKSGVTVLWITHSVEQSQSIFTKRITITSGKVEKVEVF